ncbi:MAG: DUF1214 domain-containing protein [Gammaproteobacteria bacterium]|nr:DUF1214 domain-containing protein [Gammaproteobacteria bacterium]MCP4982034.1 DUF1214 domain-containing protein [Gammaproteobacteria bacterium]
MSFLIVSISTNVILQNRLMGWRMLRSRTRTNSDGTVYIYFGPTKAPKGKEKNFIKTDPKKGFFVVFRFYGPTEGYIDKTWVMNDFELIE